MLYTVSSVDDPYQTEDRVHVTIPQNLLQALVIITGHLQISGHQVHVGDELVHCSQLII